MLIRRVARPLLSSMFITGGLEAIRNPQPKAKRAEPVIDLVAEEASTVAQKVAVAAGGVTASVSDAVDQAMAATSFDESGARPEVDAAAPHGRAETARRRLAAGEPLPFDDETYVRINGAVQVGAGVLLAFGRVPRLASATLAATLVPTTLGGHRFWEAEGEERRAQQVQFAKNLSLFGGLVLSAVDLEGRPSRAWRAEHDEHAEHTGQTGAIAARAARAEAKAARHLAHANAKAAGEAGKLGVEVAAERAGAGWRTARRQARHVRATAATRGHDASEVATSMGARVSSTAAELAPVVLAALEYALDKTAELTPKVQAAADRAADFAVDKAADLAPKVQAAAERAAERTAEATADLSPRVSAFGQRVSDSLPVGA